MSKADLIEYRLDKLEEADKIKSELMANTSKGLTVIQTKMYLLGVGTAILASLVISVLKDILLK